MVSLADDLDEEDEDIFMEGGSKKKGNDKGFLANF